jgi:hypothetical protein
MVCCLPVLKKVWKLNWIKRKRDLDQTLRFQSGEVLPVADSWIGMTFKSLGVYTRIQMCTYAHKYPCISHLSHVGYTLTQMFGSISFQSISLKSCFLYIGFISYHSEAAPNSLKSTLEFVHGSQGRCLSVQHSSSWRCPIDTMGPEEAENLTLRETLLYLCPQYLIIDHSIHDLLIT